MKVTLELTVIEADALWTSAHNGRNDFLLDREGARLYYGSPRGIGNANRAIDKLAKAMHGKLKFLERKPRKRARSNSLPYPPD